MNEEMHGNESTQGNEQQHQQFNMSTTDVHNYLLQTASAADNLSSFIKK